MVGVTKATEANRQAGSLGRLPVHFNALLVHLTILSPVRTLQDGPKVS